MSFIGQVVQWFLDPAHWQGDAGILHRTYEHVLMSGLSVLTAAVIALPVGIAIGHFGRAVLVALLSLIVEFSLAGVQRLSTPAGLRSAKSSQKEDLSGTALDTAAVAA